MKPAIPLLLAALALAAAGLARAEPGTSMRQARSEMDKGTWRGIVVIESLPEPGAPAAAASASPGGRAQPQAAADPAAAASAPAGPSVSFIERLGAVLGRGKPLSGQPMDASKRLDSPTLGIALPVAPAGASAASAAAR